MTTPTPPETEWAARQAELDAASRADAEAARRSRDQAARVREAGYDNDRSTVVGIVVAVAIALLGLFITFRLIGESQLEDCLIGHRYDCASTLDR